MKRQKTRKELKWKTCVTESAEQGLCAPGCDLTFGANQKPQQQEL